MNQRVDSFLRNEISANRTPPVGESDIHLFYDDEIKINVENLKKRALVLKTLERLSKEKDIYKQHADN